MRDMTFPEKLAFICDAPKRAFNYRKVQYLPRDEIKAIQNQRFMKLLHHAYATVPFYQKKYKTAGVLIDRIKSVDDIKELPVVEKAELIAGYPEEVLSSEHQNLDKLFMFVTGGTSGQTIRIQHTRESMFASIVSYHRTYSNMMGGRYLPHHVNAYVYTDTYPFSSFFGAYPMKFVWTLDSIDVVRDKLIKAAPHILTAYPSVLERITRELSADDRRSIARRLKVIEVNSEMSSQSQRDSWEEDWGVKVLDSFCSEEVSTMMFHQCPHKSYHIHNDLCVLESTDDNGKPMPDGEEGNLIVTALSNYAMPFIRYNQQDRIVIDDGNKHCTCSIQFPLLHSFKGRSNDAFTLKSGKVLGSGYLLDVGYSTLVKYADCIDYWALIQETKESITLECVPSLSMNPTIVADIENDLLLLFSGEASVKVKFVEAASLSEKGKRKQILSKVSHDNHC